MKYRLLLVFFMFIAPTALRAQSQNPMAMAAKAFQAKDYARAIDLLKKAYKADPNPAFLFNIARSYEKWGKYGKAADLYKQLITDKSTPGKLKSKALEGFQRIHPKIPATVTIECKPAGARLVVDGQAHGTCPAKMEHAPGAMSISVHAKGFEPWSTSLSLVPDEKSKVMAVLQKLPPVQKAIIRSKTKPMTKHSRPVQPVMTTKLKPIPRPSTQKIPERPVKSLIKRSPWPGAVIGLGVALALGGGVLQVLAYKERMDVKNDQTNGSIKGYTQQEVLNEVLNKEHKAHNYLTGAYVMYGVGAAAVVGGIIWDIMDPKHTTITTAYFDGSSIAIGVTHAF